VPPSVREFTLSLTGEGTYPPFPHPMKKPGGIFFFTGGGEGGKPVIQN